MIGTKIGVFLNKNTIADMSMTPKTGFLNFIMSTSEKCPKQTSLIAV